MLPSGSDWNGWKPLERVSYVAQLCAALALLPTVIFAYLGWREANQARQEQMQFFIAEKAPDLELSSIRIGPSPVHVNSPSAVWFTLKNVGGSRASQVRYQLIEIKENGQSGSTIRDSSKESTAVWNGYTTVDKGREITVGLTDTEQLGKVLDFKPRNVRLYTVGETLAKEDRLSLLLRVSFHGTFGDYHEQSWEIVTQQ